MGEHRVAGVEAAHPHVAEELLEPAALEGTGTTAQVERPVDDVERLVDDERTGADEADRPVRVLDAVSWNKKEAARVLEISRGTLYRKIVEYNLEPETRTSRNRTPE